MRNWIELDMCIIYISEHHRKTVDTTKFHRKKNLIMLKKLTLILVYFCFFSEHCYFSFRWDVRLSCMFVTTVSINPGITAPLTSMKFATDFVTLVSLKIPIDVLLTDNTRLYLSSYFFKYELASQIISGLKPAGSLKMKEIMRS